MSVDEVACVLAQEIGKLKGRMNGESLVFLESHPTRSLNSADARQHIRNLERMANCFFLQSTEQFPQESISGLFFRIQIGHPMLAF